MEARYEERLADAADACGSSPNVLLIHFDDAIRRLMSETLELEGYDAVACAADGAEGLARIRGSAEPLIVVLGRRLPSLDGHGVLHEIEREPLLVRYHSFLLLGSAWEWHSQAESRCVLPHAPWPTLDAPFGVVELLAAVERARLRLAARGQRPRARGQLF